MTNGCHTPGELEALRREMDGLNGELLALFEARMELSCRIARVKAQNGLPVRDPAREEAVLREIEALCKPELRDPARRFFSLLMELSRERQRNALS